MRVSYKTQNEEVKSLMSTKNLKTIKDCYVVTSHAMRDPQDHAGSAHYASIIPYNV